MSRIEPHTGHDPLEGVNADGEITTGAHRSRIPDEFKPVLEAAVEYLGRIEGTQSLYVYGSVATGTARLGKSDVDLVTVGLDATAAKTLGKELTATFSNLCRGVEIGPAELCDYEGSSDEAYGNRIFLRHYCVHLLGPDVSSALPGFPADLAAARGFNGDIGLRASQWHKELDGADPALLARRIARKTLFAVAGLVSIHDTVWTTDRIAAAKRWSAIRPELAAALATLVAWGDGRPTEVSQLEIQSALDGVVADVIAEFRERIGLWASNESGVA